MHLAAKALADSLSLAEIAKRTLLSVSFAFLIAWLIRTLLHLLAQEEQVHERQWLHVLVPLNILCLLHVVHQFREGRKRGGLINLGLFAVFTVASVSGVSESLRSIC